MVDIPGRVTCQVCCQRLAPSMEAASYRVMSMPVMAARYTTLLYPKFRHTSETTSVPWKYLLSPRK